MNPATLIPKPDAIPVYWGWLQFFLLLTFPLHLIAMNAMLGSLVIAVVEHFKGGDERKKLAHLIAMALPVVIAFVVNFGVAPLLFIQVLYGHFIYTSSILMGAFWILVIPLLIVAYYGAYLYDFRFEALGRIGAWIALGSFLLFISIAYFFSNNMLLMILPQRFSDYFTHMSGTLLASSHRMFLPRFFHIIIGAIAVGGLFTAVLGKIKKRSDPKLAEHAKIVGMKFFFIFTLISICFGIWFLFSLSPETLNIFIGGNTLATGIFVIALVVALFVLFFGYKKKVWPTVASVIPLVYLMSFLRAFVRSEYLRNYFTLDSLKVNAQYSPMIMFIVALLIGIACVTWLLKVASRTISK